MTNEGWRSVSIRQDLFDELGDYHRFGTRHQLLREAWRRYKKTLNKKQETPR